MRGKRGKDSSPRRFWSDSERALLEDRYADEPTETLAKELGRSLSAVYGFATKSGLAKSAEFLAKHCRLQKGERVGRATEFRKGQIAHNKGLRRPGYSVGRGRMQETQFKKGQAPGNYKPIGTIVEDSDGYLRIKIADGLGGSGNQKVWAFLHRHTWEQAHGPIPDGYTVVFKDRDRKNCALENLELISRKELMSRNTIHNLPPELKEPIQLLGALKRRINRKAKDAEEQAAGSTESSI